MDKRILHTKKFAQDALLDLIREKKLGEISVSELCKKATINRNTFYSHYNNPMDVLNELSSSMMTRMQTAILDAGNQREATETVCRIIQENDALSRVIFSENGDTSLIEKVLTLAATRNATLMKGESNDMDLAHRHYLSEFTIHGSAAILRAWVQSGMRETPEDMAGFIHTLCYQGTSAFTGKKV